MIIKNSYIYLSYCLLILLTIFFYSNNIYCQTQSEDQLFDTNYRLERIIIRGNHFTKKSVIREYLGLNVGDYFSVDPQLWQEWRMRLLATGFFKDVRFSLRRGSQRGWIILVVNVEERGTIILNDLFLGITDLDTFGGIDIADNNYLGTGKSLSLAFVGSEEQQGYRIRVSDPRFLGSPISLNLQLLINNAQDFLGNSPVLIEGHNGPQSYAQIDYLRIGGMIGAGYSFSYSTHIFVDYRFENIRTDLPNAASNIRGGRIEPIDFHLLNGDSFLSSFTFTLLIDNRDAIFLPEEGFRLQFAIEVANKLWGSNYDYTKFTLLFANYWKLPWNHIIKLGFFGGIILGDAPLYEMYYIGDLCDLIPARVLGLNFSHNSPINVFKTSISEMRYEEIASRIDAEYIVPIYRGRKYIYGLDFFALIGLYSLTSLQDIEYSPSGYSGAAKIPIDLTLDIGFRLDTTIGLIGLSFQNLLGLIPMGEDTR